MRKNIAPPPSPGRGGVCGYYHVPNTPPLPFNNVLILEEYRDQGVVFRVEIAVPGKGRAIFLHGKSSWEWYPRGYPIVTGCPRRDWALFARRFKEKRKQGEERKKGHQEVAPTENPQGDGDLHGGDGNSGECESAAETSSSQPRKGTENNTSGRPPSSAPSPEEGSPSEEGEEVAPTDGVKGSQGQNGRGDPGGGSSNDVTPGAEVSGGPGGGSENQPTGDNPEEEPPACSSPGADPASKTDTATRHREEQSPVAGQHARKGLCDDPSSSSGVEEEVEKELEGSEVRDDLQTGDSDGAVRSAASSSGGDFLQAVSPKVVRSLSSDAKGLRRHLLQLIQASDQCGDETSPRWSARRLVTELATKRYALGRARKSELQPTRFVLAVDVSGSCAGVCSSAWAAMLAVADQEPRAILVRHSNGYLIRSPIARNPVPPLPRNKWGGSPTLQDLLEALGRSESVRLLLNVGDLDAHDALLGAARSGSLVVHLDSYLAKSSDRVEEMKKGTSKLREAGCLCFQGVSSEIPRLERALKMALSATRKG